jgi:AcrR family transcriptional regulator
MSEARDRLLSTATRLFYAEGVHTVGIDRIIAEAGVAKATFYHHFKAKDDLVVGYLNQEYQRQRLMMEGIPGTGAQHITAIFEMFGVAAHGPGFRGCPFLNAAVEFPDPAHPVRSVVKSYRAWFRDYMKDLLAESGRPEDMHSAEVLLVLRDGIAVSGGLEDVAAVRSAIDTVAELVGVPVGAGATAV